MFNIDFQSMDKRDVIKYVGIGIVGVLLISIIVTGVSKTIANSNEEKIKAQVVAAQEESDKKKAEEEEKLKAKEFFGANANDKNAEYPIQKAKYGISVTNEFTNTLTEQLKFLQFLATNEWVSETGNKLVANPNYGQFTIISADGERLADYEFSPISYKEDKDGKALVIQDKNGAQTTVALFMGKDGKTTLGGDGVDTEYTSQGTHQLDVPVIDPMPGNMMDIFRLDVFRINKEIETYYKGLSVKPARITYENKITLTGLPGTAEVIASGDKKEIPQVKATLNLVNGKVEVTEIKPENTSSTPSATQAQPTTQTGAAHASSFGNTY